MTVVVAAVVVVVAAAVVVLVVVVSVPVAEPALLPVTEPVPAFNVAFTGDVLVLLVTTAGAFKLGCVVEISSLTFCVCETEIKN